eukprot:symbB.v1.2.019521.t1/scaffold1597.1/size110265/4
MKAFVLIHDVAADSSHPFRASVPDNRFDTAMLVAVLVALVGFACMRRIQQRRAAQRRAQRKARGTLLTALRIDSILNFRAAKAAKELALTPKERAMQKYAHTPRVHYPGDVKGTVEGFDEDGDCKVMTDTLGYMVLYLSKCQQGIGDLDGDAFPTWKEKSQKILEELRQKWQQDVEDNDTPAI